MCPECGGNLIDDLTQNARGEEILVLRCDSCSYAG